MDSIRKKFEKLCEEYTAVEITDEDRTDTGYADFQTDEWWSWFVDGWKACEEQKDLTNKEGA